MKYYFLVSYLPEIQRDDKKLKLRLADLLAEKHLFAESDWAQIELLLLAGDVLQIEILLSGKEGEVEYSLFGRDFWREQVKSPKEVPEFFEAAFEGVASEGLSPRTVEQFYGAYYAYALERTSSRLLRAYLTFEKDLRNIMAAIRARRKGLPPAEHLVGEGDLVDFLSRSTAEDFGVAGDYPWIERLTSTQAPVEIEEALQQIVWDTLDEMTEHMDFEFDAVLAYLLKLHLLERNLALSVEKGMDVVRHLEEL
jgi:hypothetical protein